MNGPNARKPVGAIHFLQVCDNPFVICDNVLDIEFVFEIE